MQSKSPSCQCQLCHKEFEVRQLQHMHRREMSLQTVYRKDYHNQAMQPTLALPARKNESSNIRGQPKSYFSLNSTYEANYQPNNPQAPVPPYKPACIGRPESFQNYKSTYRSNYLQHGAARKEESFKIADPQFYNLKTPFPQLTQYTKNYQARQSQRGSQEKRQPRPEQKKLTIRLFQTTQRHSYLNAKQVHHNLPIIPQNNVTTLPTNSSLFSTTYRNEFAKRSRVTATDLEKHSKHLVDLYHF